MNTLDDLRRTLDAHAHESTGSSFDTTSLRGRITEARKRRTVVRGGVALATVAAIAAAALVPQLGGGDTAPDPASRTAFGDVAPESIAAGNYKYAWQSLSRTDDTAITVDVEPGPDLGQGTIYPLLSWTTQDDDAVVTIRSEYDMVLWSSETSDFDDHAVLDWWVHGPVTVTSSKPGLAVATYQFDASAPIEGDTAGGFTFPAKVGDKRLLGSAVSEPGSTSVRLDLSGIEPGTRIAVALACRGGIPEKWNPSKGDTWASVSLNGGDAGGDACYTANGIAHHTPVSAEVPAALKTVEVTLEGYRTGTPVPEGTYPDGRLAVAVYTSPEPINFHGTTSQPTRVVNGHTWKAVHVERGPSTAPLTARLSGPGPWLASSSVLANDGGGADGPYDEIAPDLLLRADGEVLGYGDAGSASLISGEAADLVRANTAVVPVGTRTVTLPAIASPVAEESQLIVWERVD